MTAAFAACAALEFQNADIDVDIALVVGRCVGDEIDRQIEEIVRVTATLSGRSGECGLKKITRSPQICWASLIR